MRVAPPRLPSVWQVFALIVHGTIVWGLLVLGSAGRAAEPLPGTAPLVTEGNITSQLVAGADKFLLDEIAASVGRRPRHWHRDVSSPEKYATSVAANRQHLAKIIGAVDARLPITTVEVCATDPRTPVLAESAAFQVYAIRWPVFPGVYGEGLLLSPTKKRPIADVIAIPDADQTPEMLAGLAPGIRAEAQFARRLAESGCRVIVPMLLDRADTYSVVTGGTQPTNLPHREFIYRQAFEMGRHVIGYEVQKVLSLVDWLKRDAKATGVSVPVSQPQNPASPTKIGIYGYGEGGLIALYAAALDTRIDVTATSGYFRSRQQVWEEPIYRNVWGLLDEFGDAELATLVAPRPLIVEACRGPEISGPPAPGGKRPASAAPGRLDTPPLEEVQRELARAQELVSGLQLSQPFEVIASNGGTRIAGQFRRTGDFSRRAGALGEADSPESPPQLLNNDVDADRSHSSGKSTN